MAHRTYTSRVIVIKKTKLGESDLILTLLAEDGQQLRAVAKGARKPTSQFASRLELFSCTDVLIAMGRNLDVVSEARLVECYEPLRSDYDACIAANPMAELLCRITDKGLVSPQLFPLTEAAFSALCTAGKDAAALLCSAYLLKVLSLSGFKPSFNVCVVCANTIHFHDGTALSFSNEEGGVVCPECRKSIECASMDSRLIQWAHTLLYTRFNDIASFSCDERTEFQLLQFCQQWSRYHAGINLKSLTFFLTNGAM